MNENIQNAKALFAPVPRVQLGVTARALSNYYVPEMAGVARNGLLLGYGMAEEKRIPELVGRLVQAYRGCLEAGSSCDLNRAMAHPEALP